MSFPFSRQPPTSEDKYGVGSNSPLILSAKSFTAINFLAIKIMCVQKVKIIYLVI